MKKIAVICALKSELELIKESITNLQTENVKGAEVFFGGIGNNLVYCTECGIGKVNSAVRTQMVIDKFDVDMVINTGIAGSLDERAKHLAIVLAEKLFYHDFDLDLFGRIFPFQRYFSSSEELCDIYLKANEDVKDIVRGDIATGDEFVTSDVKKAQIKENYSPIACEMEGASIAHTAFLNNLPFLVIRCISDLADDNANQTYDEFEVISAHKVAKTVVKFIAVL